MDYFNNRKLQKEQKEKLAKISEDLNKIKQYPEWVSLEESIKSLAVSIINRLTTETSTDYIKDLQAQLRTLETIISLPDIYNYEIITGEQG